MDDELPGNLWVGISRQTKTGSAVVGVCYRLPDQEEAAEDFYIQLE